MEHTCWWDAKHHCVRIELVGVLEPDQAEQLMDQWQDFRAQHEPCALIVDHSKSPRAVSRETRAVLERRGKQSPPHKNAFVGMNNLNRMIAHIIVSILRQTHKTRFFETMEEALVWITEDRQT